MDKQIKYLIIFILLFLLVRSIVNRHIYETFDSDDKVATNDDKIVINDGKKAIDDDKEQMSVKNRVYSELLAKLKEVFDELDIPFFLSSGTCLGYFRENKFIEHDYDIDIGIYNTDYTDEVVEVMKKHGFINYRVLGTEENGLELSFVYPGTPIQGLAKVDIFLHYIDDEGIWWASYARPTYEKQVKYRVKPFTVKKVMFMGTEVGVPYPTLDYIVQHYGKDWMIPKKPADGYYYATSPVSIVKDE